MVWVVTYGMYGEADVIGVAATEERAQQLASDDHDAQRNPKYAGPLHWEDGHCWNVARGQRYNDSYIVAEHPIVE